MQRVLPVVTLLAGLLAGVLASLAVRPDTSLPRAVRQEGGPRGVPPGKPVAAETDPEDRLVIALPRVGSAGGGERITGHVATEDGRPVAGAVIRAERAAAVAAAAARGRDSGNDRPLHEWAQRVVLEEHRRRVSRVSAGSGEDGAFELRGLLPAKYHLSAWHPQYEITPSGDRGGRWVPPGAVVDFTATPVASIEIAVVRPSGKRVAVAVIEIKEAPDPAARRRPWSDGEPTVRVRSGAYSIRALSEDEELASAWHTVRAIAPERRSLTLELAERAAILGRVLRPADSDAMYAFVYVLANHEGREPDGADLARRGRRTTAPAYADFRYAFDDIGPGRYAIGAALGTGPVARVETVTVERKAVWKDLKIAAPEEPERILVRVVGPDGEPVADARLQATKIAAWRPPPGMEAGAVLRRGPGEFLVPKDLGTGEPEPRLRVIARSGEYGTMERELTPSTEGRIVMRYEKPATVELTVPGYAGSALSGKVVLELRTRTDGPRMPTGMGGDPLRLGPDGTLSLGPVQPGQYELVAYSSTHGKRVLHHETLTLVPGPNVREIALPVRLNTLEVRVRGGTEGGTVTLSRAGPGPRAAPVSKTIDASGRAVFSDLPGGKYLVWYRGTEGSTRPRVVEVTRSATLELTPEK